MQLKVNKLVDGEKIGVELDVQKKVVAEQKRGMAIVQKQVLDGEVKCVKLQVDLTSMDNASRMERLSLKAAENLTKKQRDEVRKELDEVLKKRQFMETKTQKVVVGLEEQLLQSQKQTEEVKVKVAELEAELVKASQLVSISNLDSGKVEL